MHRGINDARSATDIGVPAGLLQKSFFHVREADCLNESDKLRTVVSIRLGDFDAGNDVGLNSAHQVNLDPVALFDQRLVAGGLGFKYEA